MLQKTQNKRKNMDSQTTDWVTVFIAAKKFYRIRTLNIFTCGHLPYLAVLKSGHQFAKVGRFVATFSRGWKAAVNLPRSAGWDHRAENWPSTCQGRQVEDIPLIMDWVNGWKVAMNLPRSAGWGQKAHYGWKPAINLPRSAGWERGRQPAKVGRLSPQKKVWFNLPRSAGLWPLFQPATYGWYAQVF